MNLIKEGGTLETRLWRGVQYDIMSECFGRAATPRRVTQPLILRSLSEVVFNDNSIRFGRGKSTPSRCIPTFTDEAVQL